MAKREVIETGFVKWFSELSNKDVAVAGGKGASLAEMYNSGFPIPPGFMVTAQAYRHFIGYNKLDDKISQVLKGMNFEDTGALQDASKRIRKLVEESDMPPELEQEIIEAYDILDVDKHDKKGALDLMKKESNELYVAVRSSATTEDLADASFAGQQDSFLGVKGHKLLIQKVKECFSSLFTARAIYYRQKKGFGQTQAALAVVVQKMINSEKSGVIFSKNPLKNDGNIVMEAVWGLGEGIVSGKILPDHYVINQKFELVDITVPEKKIELIRGPKAVVEVKNLEEDKREKQVLTGYEIKRLAQYALQLEEHYKKPQDIEFAIDNEIYIVQSRPITTKVREDKTEVRGNVLLSGLGASPGVGSGVVRIVHDIDELAKVQKGDVMVTVMTNPDMVVGMQRAAGIVTDEGGTTSHAAIVSREMGIPCVVGTRTATSTLKDGQMITVDGFTGRVLEGKIEGRKVEIRPIVHTERTKVKVIVDLPDYAARAAESGAQGVGLVRLEGIIGASGKHPIWYLKKNKLRDYVTTLSKGLKKIAGPFKEIWVRTSDIRSDEYQHLEGAPEQVEGNPMLGNHGIRFSLKNADLLESELFAIKEVADEFPEKKIGIMMPQVISVDELKLTKKIAGEVKLPKNVVIGIMVETPAAVQTIELFCQEGIAFASFGTNDLTQFTLAIDRNNQEIQDLYNEMHPAVLSSLRHVIRICRQYGVETSICGQAGSRPEMVRFLMGEGISGVTVNADAAYDVSQLVASLEKTVVVQEISKGQKHEEKKGEIPMQVRANRPQIMVREEDVILKALEDEDYNPSGKIENEVPSLNDAIPITSDHFTSGKEENLVDVENEEAIGEMFPKDRSNKRDDVTSVF